MTNQRTILDSLPATVDDICEKTGADRERVEWWLRQLHRWGQVSLQSGVWVRA